uniref:membrane-spanning 4-domains subfamily A member 4A-like isoform X3 n=1 Tax=Epinephelus lanceolatus TaxID=310571 RepID=UPI001447C065|nr:membrane-spanning 4-domains subfamily A member 4A-like isoform X3 [Epinephelus lanceolatus]
MASAAAGSVVVVTHVHPLPQGLGHQHYVDTPGRFSKGRLLALGTVQIMIGLMVLLFGVAMAVNADTIGVFSGIFVWGALFYIAAGSLTVAAGNSMNCCMSRMQGFSGVLAIFHFLELIVSITVAAFACNATCNCCAERPSIVSIPENGPVTTHAASTFQAPSVSVANVPSQIVTGYKNPEETRPTVLSDPPPYNAEC